MKKFLEDLKNELIKQHMLEQDINDIISDHEEMIQNAINEGLTEEEMKKRFGNPEELAKELASFSSRQAETFDIPEDYQLWKSFSLMDTDLRIKIALVSEDIQVSTSSDNQIHVYYKGKADINKYYCDLKQDEFILEAPKLSGFIFMKSNQHDIDFILEFPTSAHITNFSFNSVSSDFNYVNLNSDIFTLSTTSGDVTLKNAKLKETKWNTVSGDLFVSYIKVNSLISSQVSGDLHMKNVYVAQNMKLNTVSGDIHIEESVSQECLLHSVSGDINGREFYPSRISLKSINGDITIKNKNHTDIEVISKSSVSGEINIQI